MSSCKQHSNLCSSFTQSQVNRQRQPGLKIEGLMGAILFRYRYSQQSLIRCSDKWISHWRARRIMIRRLQALNDHYLKDIGLERSDIVSMVEQAIELNLKPKYKVSGDNSNSLCNLSKSGEIHGEPVRANQKKLR